MNDASASLGHNEPPLEDRIALLMERMQATVAENDERFKELTAAADRVPATLNADSAEKATVLVKQVNELKKALVAQHGEFKAGPLAEGRAVDAFFKNFTESLDKVKKDINGRIKKHLEAEEKRKAAEAEEKRKAAEEAMADANVDQAIALAKEAQTLEAGKGSVRSDYGTSASLHQEYQFEVTDFDQIPRGFLMVDQQKVREGIAAGLRTIPGLKITPVKKAVTR